jgi:hypothetical protein
LQQLNDRLWRDRLGARWELLQDRDWEKAPGRLTIADAKGEQQNSPRAALAGRAPEQSEHRKTTEPSFHPPDL